MNGLASFRMVCRVVPLFLAFPLMCFSAESQFARTASAPAAAMDVALRGEQPETEPIELNPNADLEGETREADYTLASTPMRAELPTLEFVAEGAGGSAHAAKITAREGEAGALQRAIRIDKGEMLTFSADVRAEGVRSVEIVVVPRVRRPGGPGAVMPGDMGRSKKLTGSFDWTTLTFDHAFRGNFDDALLQIVVQGPGTVWIDNVRVQAHWPKKVEIPDKPAAPLLVLVLMHSETPEAYVRNRDFFRADAAKYEEMAKMLQRYGARLGLEPERELWLGARQFDPDFPRRMHERYGASFSVHTHGPQGRPTEQDVLDYVQLRKKEMEEMGAGPVTDLNGNFDMPDYDAFATIGIHTMTAFKNPRTQMGLAGYYLHPWRPTGTPYDDEEKWSVHRPGGKVVYIPGCGAIHTDFHDRFAPLMERWLRVALSRVRADRLNTFYFVEHVGRFTPHKEGQPPLEYVQSQDFRDDLERHETLVRDVLAPLVQSGHVVYSTPADVHERFEKWEKEAGIAAAE